MTSGFLVKFCLFLTWFLLHSNINTWVPKLNTTARKADFESAAFRNFDFEKILNNDSQDPDENLVNTFNFKDSQYFTPKHSCYGWKWHFLAKKHYTI